MKEEHEESKEQVEIDPFSRLMFGDRRPYKQEDNSSRKEHDWLFGSKPSRESTRDNSSFLNGSLGDYLQKVDYIEIMNHVDTLMASANELKPLIKKVKPVIESFLNKK